ncbi:MAG: hypothetical protein WAV89_05805 [Ignavibacteriaceae bacterium]
MNNDEKFSKYLFNEMSENEKHSFEDELKSSGQMKDDFESYQKVIELVKETKNIQLDVQYTRNIIPEFRRKLEKRNHPSVFVKFGYVFVALFFAVFGYSIVTKVLTEKQDLQKVYSDLTNDEVSYLAAEMNIGLGNDFDENTIEKIDSVYNYKLYENVIESLNHSIKKTSEEFNLNELDQYLTDKDIDLIFAELTDKEIIQR